MKNQTMAQPKRRRPLMRRWFLSYLIIALIPLATGFGIYIRAKDMLAQELIGSHRAVLQQLRTSVDTHFSELNSLVFQLKNVQELVSLSLAQGPMSNSQIYMSYELSNTLRVYQTANEFIEEVGVWYPRSDCIVTSTGKYDLSTYYAAHVKGRGVTETQWLSALQGAGVMPRLDLSLGMVYLCSLNEQTQGRGAVIFLKLDDALLESYFTNQSILQQGSMLVTVPDGEEVFSSGGNVTELRELLAAEAGTDKAPPADFLYTNMRSQVNGWQYAFLVPYAQVTRKTQYIISYTLTITGLAVALSILFAGLFSRIQYQPVSRLMKHVARQSHGLDGHVSEYTLLEQHIETLSCDRADMQTQLTTQGMELGLENLRRLLLGISYATGSEKEALQRYGVTFEGELFRVVTVAAAENVMHDDAFFARVKALFTGAFSHGSVHVLRVMDAICCVISTARPEGDQADAARLREMWNGLAAQVEGPLWMAVSLQHRELLTLPAAYAESTRALQQRTMSESGGLVFYDEAKRNTAFGGIYYPNGFDTRLIHILCSGDLAMMRACVDEVIEQNLRQSITVQQCTYLGYHLCMSFLKAAKECQGMYQLDLSALMEQMVSSLQLDQISALREHYGRLCESLADEIARANRGQEESLIDRIRACVAEHYTDPNLNVNTISDLLSMNASYISRAFADKTGETLSAYLQRIRIEAALPLIRAGQPIAGVMERTGYANVTTFNRAFKKEMGMTPGLYREAERKKSHIDQENEQPSHSSK